MPIWRGLARLVARLFGERYVWDDLRNVAGYRAVGKFARPPG